MVYDIFYVSKNISDEHNWKQFRLKFPSAQKIDNVKSFDDIKKKTFTKFCWVVWDDLTLLDLSIFEFRVPKFEEEYIHVFKNRCNSVESYFGGVVLFPKNCKVSSKEFQHKFYLNKKEHDIVASKYCYPVLKLTAYEEYVKFATSNPHPLFWGVWPDIEIVNNDVFDLYFDPNDGKYDYDRSENHMYKNSCNGVESYLSGVVLFSSKKIISKREFNRRFLVDKKEHDLIVSKYRYPRYYIDTYEEYLEICKTETHPLFWCIWPEIEITDTTIFDMYFDPLDGAYDYDRQENHVFQNQDIEEIKYNGLMLMSTAMPVSKKEIDFRYVIVKKEHEQLVSKLKLYDIVFISYNEPNADENFTNLIERFPRAKRIHGVKGIHQAHIAAAKLATTPMFWVVDGDAVVEDNFVFDLLLPKHDTDIVHVWLSRNPINNLTYGYGGVKLLPRDLTENMDLSKRSIDMTMSISSKFRVMQTVSNITAFNTDPFNTWKSAFRECVKLASRPVNAKYQEETEDRLFAWCNYGKDSPLGEYAIMGATAGRQFGIDNIANPAQLANINDFDWLLDQFHAQTYVKKSLD